jgi:hypothetical protein
MRIYRERITTIAKRIVDDLMADKLIEVEAELVEEVILDLESVLKEYRRADRELSEQARDLVSLRGLDYSYTHKIKQQLAREKAFELGDEAVDWIAQQMLEMLLQSANVEEIWAEDNELRRVIAPTLKRELGMDVSLDREVKKRIKNLAEGTADYEIEYQKTMDRLRDAKKLQD